MAASILSFGSRSLPRSMPWQNQDYAEFYRVRDRLNDAGYAVETDSGLSDEGEPWFVFQRAGSDDILVHIARIDRELVVVNGMTGQVFRGGDFRGVVDRLLEGAELVLPQKLDRNGKVVLHPSMVLTAFVAAAFLLGDQLMDGQAEAAELTAGSADGSLPAHLHGELVHSAPADGPVAAYAGRRSARDAAGTPANSNAAYSPLHDVASSAPALGLSISLFAAELTRLLAADAGETHTAAADDVAPAHDGMHGPDLAAAVLSSQAEAGAEVQAQAHEGSGHGVQITAAGLMDMRAKATAAEPALYLDGAKDLPASSGHGTHGAQLALHMELQPSAVLDSPNVIQIPAAAQVTPIPAADTDMVLDTRALVAELLMGAAIESVSVNGGETVITLRLDPAGSGSPASAAKLPGSSSSTSLSASEDLSASAASGAGAAASSSAAISSAERHADTGTSAPAGSAVQPVIFTVHTGNDLPLNVPSQDIRTVSFADGIAEAVSFTDGHTVVDGFRLGEDRIDLSNLFAEGHHVVVAIEGSDIVMVEDNGNSITLVGVLDPAATVTAEAA